ncbi:hypothetical protein L914_10241 [Phytophthora nicotianae]|uniref:Uncharacterized protein n=1 Tax=Phytophthora nicotianae TaxID=4792 RepID=W2NA04_PHYNI|nr:hypothetical protein L914_10241 [Phytophthora nicotianae]
MTTPTFLATVCMHAFNALEDMGGHLLIERVTSLTTSEMGGLRSTTHRNHWKRWFVSWETKPNLWRVPLLVAAEYISSY